MQNSEEATQLHYLKEAALYVLWKYFNGRRLIKKGSLKFLDLLPYEFSINSGVDFVIATLDLMGLDVQNPVFHKEIFLKYNKPLTSHDMEVKALPEGSAARLAQWSIYNQKFTFQDLKNAAMLLGKTEMANFIEFDNALSEKSSKKLASFLEFYIEEFINDRLLINKQNYLKFSKQKERLVSKLLEQEEEFGNQFILEETSHIEDQFPYDPTFLFIHILIALEKLGYLTVQSLEVGDPEKDPMEAPSYHDEAYNAKVVLTQRFYDEFKPGQKNKVKPLSFDADTSILVVDNKIVVISKTKNSDPHYLLSLIFTDPAKTWNYDEIWADPYFKSREDGKPYNPKTEWRKIYNAARSANHKIAQETGVKDFLSFNKTTIAITKTYQK